MSEVQSCACDPAATKPAVDQSAKKTGKVTKKLLSLSIGGGLLCVLACAAGPLLVGLGIALTATAIATGLIILGTAGVAVIAFVGVKAIVKRKRAALAKTSFVRARLDSTGPEIACNPSAVDPSRRQEYESVFDTVLHRAKDIRNTGEQIVLRYNREAETFIHITNWIRDEQECCPFLTFNVEVQPKDGEIVVHLGKGKEITNYLMELINRKIAI